MSKFFSRTPIQVDYLETDNRKIHTPIPCEGSIAVLDRLDKYESRSMHGQIPLVWHKATGFNIFDEAGNKWIDLTSTIFVTNIGHSNPYLTEKLKDTIDSDLLHTYAYTNQIRADYLEKLIDFAPDNFEKAFLLSAGTETTEAALKLMRMNGQKSSNKKIGIVCFEGNWHGRTMGAQMMGGNEGQKEWIGYKDPNIYHIRFPYPWVLEHEGVTADKFLDQEIENLITRYNIDMSDDICGFMLETFQGWGAVFYPTDFVKKIREICDNHKILLCFDEMQAGFYRTGKKFGYQHYDIIADIICCGKGIGSGLPLSAVLSTAEIMDLPSIGNMSSTHSANPLVCAAGLATLEFMEDNNIGEKSKILGEKFHSRLNRLKEKFPKLISRIEGDGMIAAIIFKLDDVSLGSEIASKASWECFKKGVFVVHTGRESIKLGPPLTIPEQALMESLDVIDEVLFEINNEY